MNLWELIVQQPVINVLIVLSHYLADSFGMAIIALTIVVNVVMMPFTLKQIKTSQMMQQMQPKLAELQKKYAKDKQMLAKEQMRLYRESGMNPTGCLLPMLIQMPIWIALYQSIMLVLAVAPEGLLNLSRYLYPWPMIYSLLPLGKEFLWVNLADPDTFLAIMVGATMWIQQKMTMTVSSDPRQQSQSRMMLWMMPLMFAFLGLSFPSGLALFWVTSSVVRIAMQYYTSGWGGLAPLKVEKGPDKPYIKHIARVEKGTTEIATGADIVETGEQKPAGGLVKPSKTRYQPAKDRSRTRKKK